MPSASRQLEKRHSAERGVGHGLKRLRSINRSGGYFQLSSSSPTHSRSMSTRGLARYQLPNIRVSDHDGQLLIFDAADFA
jgi:hypothetical protein